MTIMEAREMNKRQIETELGKYTNRLMDFGLTKKEACEFVSSVMNLGIASQEKWNKGER